MGLPNAFRESSDVLYRSALPVSRDLEVRTVSSLVYGGTVSRGIERRLIAALSGYVRGLLISSRVFAEWLPRCETIYKLLDVVPTAIRVFNVVFLLAVL